jgi:methionyl-tRNA formyltransferase
VADTPALRIVFFGTPEIAAPTLERLLEGPHEVVGVVSQPDRGRGRGRKLSPSPVAEIALREGLPMLRPEKVGDPETVAALEALAPDVGVVVAFGQFIPKRVRELPSRGYLINAHASLLPRYRGAAPIARAILAGESETGISVMRVEKEMDAGAVALMERIPIDPMENVEELSARLATLAAGAIAAALDRIASNRIEWTDQDASAATFAAKIEKHDAVLDLREPARALVARIHAVSPKPGGAVTLLRDDGETTLKISRASAQAPAPGETLPEPGTIVLGDDDDAPLRIATGDGWLRPRVIQRPGGRPLPVAEFLRGFPIGEDERLALASAEAVEAEAEAEAKSQTETRQDDREARRV